MNVFEAKMKFMLRNKDFLFFEDFNYYILWSCSFSVFNVVLIIFEMLQLKFAVRIVRYFA